LKRDDTLKVDADIMHGIQVADCLDKLVLIQNNIAERKNDIVERKKREQKEQKEKEQHRLSQERQEKKDIIFNLRTMPYDEYLYTEHWREFRKVALKNAKNKCQL